MASTWTSGTVARVVTQGNPGAWLLELDLGSERVRVASRAVTVHSRDVGAEVRFSAGLADMSSPLTIDSASLEVVAPARAGWPVYRRKGPLRGRRARFWRWYPGLDLEDAFLVIDGVVTAAEWGAPGEPETLKLQIGWAPRERSIAWPRPGATVNSSTFDLSSTGTTVSAEKVQHQHYPTVIGAPGDGGGTDEVPFVATPGLFVRTYQRNAVTYSAVVIAGHHVEAETVRLKNSTKGDQIVTATVDNTYDDEGRPIAMVNAYDEWWAGTNLAPEDEVWVGWSRSAGWGHGLMFRGRPVTGAGDLLLWGAVTLSTAPHDYARLAGNLTQLNQIKIDTYWNEPLAWEDWVQRNILAHYPIDVIQGPAGRYYVYRDYEARPERVQARLVAGQGGGRRVDRIAPIVERDGDVVNIVEMDYAEKKGGSFRRKLTVGPALGALATPPGGAQVEASSANMAAAVSAALFGPRSKHVELPTTWDPGTAGLVARRILAESALPGRQTRYVGGEGLLDLYEYATVHLIDRTFGAEIDALAIVEDVTITPAGIEIDVWIPEDPARVNQT